MATIKGKVKAANVKRLAKSTIAKKARGVTRTQASNLARSKGFGGSGG